MGVNTRFKDVTVRLVKPILYTAFFATLAFGGGKLIPSARADPPKPVPVETSRRPAGPVEEQPPAGTKEAETPKAPRPLDPELAKLKKVSLGEMQRLAKETCRMYNCRTDTVDAYRFWQSSVVDITLPDGRMSAIASIGTDSVTGKVMNDILIAAKGKAVPTQELRFDELARLYKLATGNTLKYVRLAVAPGHDVDGDYIGIHIIPVEKPDGDLKPGVPVKILFYYLDDGKAYKQPYGLISEDLARK